MKRLLTFLIASFLSVAIFGQSTFLQNLRVVKTTPMVSLMGSGGILDFNSSDIRLTNSPNLLTLSGGDFALGANNFLLTGSIGTTGARITKGWFTDLELTNLPTIGGVSLSSLYAPTASPTFTGTVSGITATMVGLGNVTNASQATMFSSPNFTGTPTAPTAGLGTNTTQIATTAFVLANGGTGSGGTWGTISGTLGNQTDLAAALALKATLAAPTFTGTVVLPSTTSIGTVSNTEISYLDNVTSAIQTQFTNTASSIALKSNSASPTFTGTVVLPSTTSIGSVSNTEIGYIDGVTSALQTQLTNLGSADALKANLASPTFTGTVTLPSTTSVGTVSSTELGYVDGVTSAIQTQLNNTDDLANVALLKHPTITAKTDSYTLQLADDGTIITMNKATATDLTVPLNSSVLFPVGTQITISCIGAGKTTVVATGGVTIISKGSYLGITVLGDATLIKLGVNSWKLIGSLE
jgi:hypothetical protein